MAAFLHTPDFLHIRDLVEAAPMAIRKQVLTLARFMAITTSGNLSGITEKAYNLIIDSYRHDNRFPSYDPSYLSAYQVAVRAHVDDLFRDPVFAGQVIQSIFMAEVPENIADQIRNESYEKEYSIMSTSGYDPGLDFACMFGEYTRPLHCTMLPNPRMARHIHRVIDEWIDQVTSVDFYVPSISSKLLPKHTRRGRPMFLKTRTMTLTLNESTPSGERGEATSTCRMETWDI
jgi:hypothetical protein